MSTKRSRVHPNYKTQYRVGNWPSYDASLVQRGNLNIWMSPDAIKNWNAKPRGRRRRGGQPKYSDFAVETAPTLRLLLHLPFRQTEGFLISIFELVDLQLGAPDHTPLSRRSARLKIALRSRRTTGSIDLVIDSSGLAILAKASGLRRSTAAEASVTVAPIPRARTATRSGRNAAATHLRQTSSRTWAPRKESVM